MICEECGRDHDERASDISTFYTRVLPALAIIGAVWWLLS